MSYTPKPMQAPTLSGFGLRAICRLAEGGPVAGLLRRELLKNTYIAELRALPIDEAPAPMPLLPRVSVEIEEHAPIPLEPVASAALPEGEGFQFETIADFQAAYAEGRLSPVDVARRHLEAVKASESEAIPSRLFIAQSEDDLMAQAEASAKRWADGAPLGPLDGVPVAVKDEVDQRGYSTTVGTSFLGKTPAETDATAVGRLRATGAVLCGKLNMHEIGLGVTGINPHHGAARNPYDPRRFTGGSSSGSGAAVGTGVVPLALGADGGGSVRIPAAFCGVVGLKPTFGRVSEHGAAPVCWSVAHLGPLAGTARDAAVGYAVMAGVDAGDPNTIGQPAPTLAGFGEGNPFEGLRVGVHRAYFEDADPEIVDAVQALLDKMLEAGAELREIEIEEVHNMRRAQMVSILSEMMASQAPHLAAHRRDYGGDVRLNFAIGGEFAGPDYVKAQRIRRWACAQFDRHFSEVDVILTPSTGVTAGLINEKALELGESNLPLLDNIMRFAPIANITGHPAIAFPAGYDHQDLPISAQLMGRPWDEARLLDLAHASEAWVPRKAPKRHYRLLAEEG